MPAAACSARMVRVFFIIVIIYRIARTTYPTRLA
jgi:hypothetical protein